MISFVLLTWNPQDYIHRTVQSLREQTSQDWELIVVDNGSDPALLEEIRRAQAEGLVAHYSQLPHNVGYARGMNEGIRNASGDVIVAMNQDTCLARNFVEAVSAAASDAATDTGMIAVPMYRWLWNDETDELTANMWNAGVSLVKRMSASVWHPAFASADTLHGPDGSLQIYTSRAIEAAMTSSGFVFDPAYHSYGEDVDLIMRLQALGFRCESCSNTAGWHIGSASSGGDIRYEGKTAELRMQILINRFRNAAKVGKIAGVVRILPWIVTEDVVRVTWSNHRLRAMREAWHAYRRMWSVYHTTGKLPGPPPVFAGGLLSHAARAARRSGSMPRLPHFDPLRFAPDPGIMSRSGAHEG
jgi:GT2 family glycosyltransferase